MRRDAVKVLVLVPLAVFAALFAIGPGGLVSYTPSTRIAVHTVQAFWVSIAAALMVLAYQRRPHRSNTLVLSALVFSIILHIGSAIQNRFLPPEDDILRTLENTVGDLLEFAIFGVLIAGASLCVLRRIPIEEQKVPNRFFFSLAILIPSALYGIVQYFMPVLSQANLVYLGWVLGGISIVGFIVAALLIPRTTQEYFPVNIGYMVSAILLLLVSSVSTVLNLANPSMNWEYAETVQMAAFLLFCLAFGVPFLRKSGYQRSTAYGIVIGLILMAYLPFMLTILLESRLLVFEFEPLNILAYSIIHIGAASLSLMLAILLYLYPKRRPIWNHVPLILIFTLWGALSVILAIALPYVALLGELTTPIVVGSAITLVLLVLTIRWTVTPRTKRESPSLLNYSAYSLLFMIFVVLAELLNQMVLSVDPGLVTSPYGAIVLLGLNLVIMFALTYLIFLLAENSRGKPPVEMVVAFYLGMWILPNILKSYNVTWTTAWWISEILLFVGLLVGPPLLIWLYVRAIQDEQASHRRAGLYADILMHDISNYNQMVMTTLELLGSEGLSDKQRQRLADDGFSAISFSEQLISNVRLLSESDQLDSTRLEPTDIVSTVVSALNTFTQRVGTDDLKVEFKPETSHAFVMANDLLVHIFLNIFYSALECRLRGEVVTIGIESIKRASESFWQVIIVAPGKSIEDEDDYSSGTLNLTAAELMTSSLNGEFEMEHYSRLGKCDGRLFTILLRAAE